MMYLVSYILATAFFSKKEQVWRSLRDRGHYDNQQKNNSGLSAFFSISGFLVVSEGQLIFLQLRFFFQLISCMFMRVERWDCRK